MISAIEPLNKDVKHTVRKSCNDAFPLRAHLSFIKNNYGEEIAITVDVKYNDNQLLIESDISNDDGVIIAKGPKVTVMCDIDPNISETELKKWIGEFESFLNANNEVLKAELLKLAN